MTNWTDFLTDADGLRAIFGDELPTLNQVDLHEVIMHRDGPRVVLRFDLSEFPINPPKKWVQAGYSCVQLKLVAVGIREFFVEGWCSECKCNIVIGSRGKSVELCVESEFVKIKIVADFLVFDGVSAYRAT